MFLGCERAWHDGRRSCQGIRSDPTAVSIAVKRGEKIAMEKGLSITDGKQFMYLWMSRKRLQNTKHQTLDEFNFLRIHQCCRFDK
ncbi:MAG: hypothetical protein BBJ57_11120 [Desulfobacterales bacterium PC51MH44]|nr:MAG: hypothetical protein BBJ57_11120 [Desulfobacterales bacterium PC51MH44]